MPNGIKCVDDPTLKPTVSFRVKGVVEKKLATLFFTYSISEDRRKLTARPAGYD
jgi:hypothetical protein